MFELIRNPNIVRVAIAIYTLCFAGLIGGYFHIASAQVAHSAYVQGPATLPPGASVALRGVLMNARTGQYVKRVKSMHLSIVEGDGETAHEATRGMPGVEVPERVHMLGSARPEPSGLIHFKATIPKTLAPGTHRLRLVAHVRDEKLPFRTEERVEVRLPASRQTGAAWPEHMTRLTEEERQDTVTPGVYEHTGDVAIEVIPRRLELSRGLAGHMWFRTIDAATGRPLACALSLKVEKGLSNTPPAERLRTDASGLGRVDLHPISSHTWTVKASCPDGEATRTGDAKVYMASAATELSMELQQPVVFGAPVVDGAVHSLHRSGGVMVDLRDDQGRWLDARVFGLSRKSGVQSHLPAHDGGTPRLLRVQVYTSLFGQDTGWDSAPVLQLPQGQSKRDALQHLIRRHAAQPDASRYYDYLQKNPDALRTVELSTLRAMIDEVPEHFARPVTVLNSLKRDQDALAAWKLRVRLWLTRLITFATLLGFMALALAIVEGISAARERAQRMALLLADAEGELDDVALDPHAHPDAADESARAARRHTRMVFVQGLIVIGTLVMFTLCMFMLLTFL